LPRTDAGNGGTLGHITVMPRKTPAERAGDGITVEIDEAYTVDVAAIEDWVSVRQAWELTLREGTDFGRTNNVETRLVFVAGEEAASLEFRLEQLDRATDKGSELVLQFEESDGIAKLATLRANGLDLELFHILYT
jgi:uncharacterized protein YheU (UPF0270 family)